jgi:antitoxin (DNA-binding transcriptional repressor) of toxin-antitoxin stability system
MPDSPSAIHRVIRQRTGVLRFDMTLTPVLHSNEINSDGNSMRIIPADEFGANWPRLLSQLTNGEEFLLTDAGRPVGRVLPPMPDSQPLTRDEWQREFDAWQRDVQARANRYPLGYAADDSRDSIYQD